MAAALNNTVEAAYNARRLLGIMPSTASVEIDESAQDLFGTILAPLDILNLWMETANDDNDQNDANVGIPSVTSPVMEPLQSRNLGKVTFLTSEWQPATVDQFLIQLDNATPSTTLRVRWIDFEGGIRPSTHQWNVLPTARFQQYTQAGHVFIVSLVAESSLMGDEEALVFGFRAKRPLPSGKPLVLKVSLTQDNLFLVELDTENVFDAMTVAASDLDSYRDGPQRGLLQHTLQLLRTIIANLLLHLNDDDENEKYKKLRLGNPKIQQYIEASWSAMELLRLVGFEPTMLPSSHNNVDDDNNASSLEPYLKISPDMSSVVEERCRLALRFMDLLQSRLEPGFCEDLALPTPWQPVVGAISGSRGGFVNAQRGWLSEDERWERLERVASRNRSGRARRPEPGNAPSSRGRWGR